MLCQARPGNAPGGEAQNKIDRLLCNLFAPLKK